MTDPAAHEARQAQLFANTPRVPMCRITVSSSWHNPVRCAYAEGHPGDHSWASLPAHSPWDALREMREALRYARDCIASPTRPFADGEDIYDTPMMVKAMRKADAALAAVPDPEEPRADMLCRCGHTASCHGPEGCEVEVRDYGDLDCSCTLTPAAVPRG